MLYPWHEKVWQQLQSARAGKHLPHALLFSAEDGCGHEALIQQLINSLLCQSPSESGIACGHCRSCEVLKANAHPDFMYVQVPEDKQVIGVDQIRALHHFLELSCSYSAVRVAFIDQAQAMNINAANSLLKSLEEPAAHTHIILTTQHPQQLLPTIRSRCQHIRLPIPAGQEAAKWLAKHELNRGVDDLLKLATGKPLLALEMDDGEVFQQRELWAQQLLDVIQGRLALTEVGAQWAQHDRRELLDWQLAVLHTLIGANLAGSQNLGVTLEKLAKMLHPRKLWSLYDDLLELKGLATHPLNKQLFAENMLALWLKQ